MIRTTGLVSLLALLLPLLAAVGSTSSSASPPAQAKRPALSLAKVQGMTTNISGMAYAALPIYAPSSYTDRGGPSLNNPTGGRRASRTNIDRLIRMINASRGYRVSSTRQCPRVRSQFPSEIKIALYSFSDPRTADALVAAHYRCVSVQVLMNDHLTNRMVPAFGRLQHRLGTRLGPRSWARRCNNGCRGRGGVLHSKLFMFSDAARARNVVAIGSTNITGKAISVQWNDLLVFKGRTRMWNQYMTTFTEMARDRFVRPLALERADGLYHTMLWPQYGMTMKNDRVLREFRKILCARKPAGNLGRTQVSINIHAMEGDRGLYIAGQIARLKREGCNVRVLYGLIAPRIHRYFKSHRVPTRRTIFDRNGNGKAEVYTHMKLMTIAGVYQYPHGRDHNARVVYTGSENFSHRTVLSDELWMRVPGAAVHQTYQNHFNILWRSNYYSNPKYAWYSQSNTPVHARREGAILLDDEDLELG